MKKVLAVLAVVAGYLVMGIVVFGTMTAAYLALGVDRVYKPDVFDITLLWVGVATVVSFVAGVVGGAVTGLISRRGGPVVALAVITFVLGLLSAFSNMGKPDESEPRTDDIAVLDAASKTRQPAGYAFSLPFIGVISVMLGGKLVVKQKVIAPAAE